jgi:hypothetical protein
MALTHNDGGYKSRKWVGFCITSVLILLAGKFVAAAVIAEVIFGLVSVYGLFVGARNMADWVAVKSGAKVAPAPVLPADPKKPAPPPPKKPSVEEEEGS